MKYGYARGSTEAPPSISRPEESRVPENLKDERTGATTKPPLSQDVVRRRHAYCLIVWKLDRLARSLHDLVTPTPIAV